MKRIRSILLIILVFGISLPAICQKSGKKDKLKSIIVTEEKYDMLVKKQYKDSETYFDDRGNITEEITYKQGKVKKHFKYQYDADDNKIKEEEFDPSGRLMEYSEYKFENGLRVEKIVYDSNKKAKSRKVYTYTTYQVMMSSGITTVLNSLIPIKLEDMDNVRLMDRVDTKYITSVQKIPDLLNHIDGEYQVLEINKNRSFTYHTTYLDSCDYLFFNQHVTGKLERNKVRYRTYESTGATFLEVKKRTNKNRTVKWRIKNELTSENKCDETAFEFIREYLPDRSVSLEPVLTNTFKRITLAGLGCRERITIDYDLSYHDFNGNVAGFPAIAVIEMKKEGYNSRSSFGDILKGLSIQKQGFSKYCMGAGILYDLPRKNVLKQKFLFIKKIEDEYFRCTYS